MRRRVFLGLPLAFAGAYGYWISTPRVKNQEYLELLDAEAMEHLEQCQRKAVSPEANGAIAPIFEGFWESAVSPETSSELRILVEAMRGQSIYAEPAYLSEEAEPASEADPRARFQTRLPSLHRELIKPVFFTEKIGYDSSDISLDAVACKNLAIALSAEASALAQHGDSEGFLQCLRSILGLSRGYRAFPHLVRTMISHSIADVALQTVIDTYSPNDGAPWGEISRLLLAALPRREDLVLCMKCEFAFGDAVYKGVLAGKLSIENIEEFGEELPFWKRLPGQVSREHRTYRRDYSEFIAALESGQSTSVLKTDVAQKFHGYLRRLGVFHDFQKTTALVCEALGKRDEPGFRISHLVNSPGLSPGVEVVGGDVSFSIEDDEVEVRIVSSHWVESADRKVLFRMGRKV